MANAARPLLSITTPVLSVSAPAVQTPNAAATPKSASTPKSVAPTAADVSRAINILRSYSMSAQASQLQQSQLETQVAALTKKLQETNKQALDLERYEKNQIESRRVIDRQIADIQQFLGAPPPMPMQTFPPAMAMAPLVPIIGGAKTGGNYYYRRYPYKVIL